jgi:rhodanese-related sulfurtransferase
MRIKRRGHQIFGVAVAILCLVGTARGIPEMSDAKKKETVYQLYAAYKKDFPDVRDIAPKQALELLNHGKVVFVDTRKSKEMSISMIPGAVSGQHFLDHMDQYSDKTIVVYCTISYRSGMFARDLTRQGIPILNLKGGILAWLLEGGKVVDPSGKEVQQVHVYGDRWDYAPAGYTSVKFSLWE